MYRCTCGMCVTSWKQQQGDSPCPCCDTNTTILVEQKELQTLLSTDR